MRVALLGTGKMGAAIARRVAGAGHELTLWNRTRERAEAVGVGTVAATPAEAVRGAEVVLSILFGPDSVEETYAQLTPERGQIFCEMSTAGPDLPAKLAPAIEEAGAILLTCPLLGSIPALENGSATLLIGGDQAAGERAKPVLEAFSQPEPGGTREQAAGLKLLNNAMLGIVSAAAAELLSAARRQGVPEDKAFARLRGFVPYLGARERGFLGRDHANPSFDVSGMRKDLDLELEAGHRSGAALPLTAAARELFGVAEPDHAGEELTSVIETLP